MLEGRGRIEAYTTRVASQRLQSRFSKTTAPGRDLPIIWALCSYQNCLIKPPAIPGVTWCTHLPGMHHARYKANL